MTSRRRSTVLAMLMCFRITFSPLGVRELATPDAPQHDLPGQTTLRHRLTQTANRSSIRP
ncbi:hypothetical protein SCATT_01550 [Streptantibioticus cattleyicolor NRRL 8057 = DSM 46488]|uniref:Uncharacterized protein n=1 Tax=Streptantibioticus cattleyicolor (strain ATCC 35852 / DSM 46488 / JCM 4925 / NBRC 14057 / NRRL 8057) TaxID=1003195 RepID=F8JVX4_STREN|nr:hypothetical protein SCATT_01550 [Streptantibioticus cattleyicolor NRRL 8057 = DSM 46488]MYS57322.1 hypothetical protein [Streptomyces sp. SID5468]CCB72885.1 exported protein of unknown function [Streptantibioticus cattleyicolor NRRL 8057 = DSM 46488]